MKFEKPAITALVMSALLVALSGCQKSEEQAELPLQENKVELHLEEGTAEHAGRKIDAAAAKAGEKIEQAGESIKDAAKGDQD